MRVASSLAPLSSAVFARSRAARWVRLAAWPLALYALGAVALLARLGSHPPFAYNWEHYTAWGVFHFIDHPTWRIFGLNQGLMTDSGQTPIITLPAWLAFTLSSQSLTALRAPSALLSAAAAPLLWLVGRRLVGPWAAAFAALLLIVSPAWWLYGRTATSVGLSLVPELATSYVLLRLLERPEARRWRVALLGLLCVGVYFYAPLRFLWLLSLGLLALEAWLRPEPRRALASAFVVVAAVIPLWITLLSGGHPLAAFDTYYGARGEQILNFGASTQGLADALGQPEPADSGIAMLTGQLLGRNLRDYVNLLLDRHTDPLYTDFATPHGRLYPWFLVPLFMLGCARAARRAPTSLQARVLLVLFAGLGLPMILTTKVHVGRLIFILPLLLLLVADGARAAASWTGTRSHAPRIAASAPAILAVALLFASCVSAWHDEQGTATPLPAQGIAATLRAKLPLARTHGGAALVLGGPEWDGVFEAINLAPARLALDDAYTFVDVRERNALPSGAQTLLYYGALLERPDAWRALPNACQLLYLVWPDQEQAFLAEVNALCPTTPPYALLPS